MNLHQIAPTRTVETPGARVRLYSQWGTAVAGHYGISQGWVTTPFNAPLIKVVLDNNQRVYAQPHELVLIR